jgi:predicted phage-related endonuclease
VGQVRAVNAPTPGTPEWAAKVTASKVAAILGLSPFESPYAMWRMMRGDIPWPGETAPMRRGNMLENAVLDWWLADHPDVREVARQRFYPLEEWAGATPDLDVIDEDGEVAMVDAKTIGRDDEWGEEPPTHYIASSMWQLACNPAAKRVHLAVLFGSPFDLRTFTVERDDDLIAGIVARCREFYDSLALDDPPALDDSVATYEAVRALHPDIDPDLDVEVDRSIAHEYVTASLALKDAETRDRAARTVLLDAMGRARIATCDGAKVARRQPNRSGVSLVRTAKHIDPPQTEETAA